MKRVNIKFYCLIIAVMVLLLAGTAADAQSEKVHQYLRMVAQGKIDDVKKVLPDLMVEFPDDPGVQLLTGVVIDDAYRALDIYDKIIKKYSESEFADEAYWRIVTFYAVKGDTVRALGELENYRKKFPNSEFLNMATDVVRSAIRIAKSGTKAYVINLDKKIAADEPVAKKEAEKQEKKAVTPPPKQLEKEKAEDKPKEDDKDARFGLQVGVYSTQEAAKAEVERFRTQRLRAEIMSKKVDGAHMFAVVIGDYSTKESAEAAKNIVQQQCNCNPIIFKK